MTDPEANILVVDDDALIREELCSLFESRPFRVSCADSPAEALKLLHEGDFALALVDVRIAHSDGLALTREIRERWPNVDVIMITGYGSIQNAVAAMREGAIDYITKPFQPEELLLAVRRALERQHLIDEIEHLRRELSDRHSFANMVSRNPGMLDVFDTIEMLANNDVTVLVYGESGTGKELTARAIHYQGKRRAGRFVAVNCAAVPDALFESELFGYERGAFTGANRDRVGKIELANGGTLFLDEVESISLATQAKLLRVLEERTIEPLGGNRQVVVDMRVVAASNRDLGWAVRDGRMREDFYYRINVVPVHLPPLRDRTEDIPLLVNDFLLNSPQAREKGLNRCTERVLHQLVSHQWPGNIRELSNVLERAVLRARGDTIREVDISSGQSLTAGAGPAPQFLAPLREFLKGAERQYLEELLSHYHGGIARCARHASIDQATLHRKIKAHGLRADEFRRNGRMEELTAR